MAEEKPPGFQAAIRRGVTRPGPHGIWGVRVSASSTHTFLLLLQGTLPEHPQPHLCGKHHHTAHGRVPRTKNPDAAPVPSPLPLRRHPQRPLPTTQRPGEATADQDEQPQLGSAGARPGQRGCRGGFCEVEPLPGPGALQRGVGWWGDTTPLPWEWDVTPSAF